MNLKLEVARINEDVIATSGICKNISDDYHVKVITYNPSGKDTYSVYCYDNVSGKLICDEENLFDDVDNYVTGISSTGWYHSTDDTTYYKCDENCEHPVKPN